MLFRSPIATFACFLITAAHFLFAFLPNKIDNIIPAIIGYSMIGLSYCLFGTASWAMIPYVVEDKVVGTAFGIGFAFENIGNVFGPMIVGLITDNSKESDGTINYRWVSVFLGIGSAIGLLMNFLLICVDSKNGGVLMSANAAER